MPVSTAPHVPPAVSDPLLRTLQERGVLRAEEAAAVERLARETDVPVPAVVARMGVAEESVVAEALARITGLPVLRALDYPVANPLPATISERFLKAVHAVPVADDGAAVTLAAADPREPLAAEALAIATGRRIVLRVGVPSLIFEAIDRCFGRASPAEGVDAALEAGEGAAAPAETDVAALRDLASEAPVIRLVNLLLRRALEAGASDIHLEPCERHLQLRFRVDGLLRDVSLPGEAEPAAVISRIKIMARLDIGERRLPQDGRMRVRMLGRDLDLRVATLPTLHGEGVVLRLLERERVPLDFAALGFSAGIHQALLGLLAQPHGILLVTGPTGSGKTTTLYTALRHLHRPERKIVTVEDPVEYQLDGVNQIAVKPAIGLTFASALRAIVRQDPDVILVGEMRDLETAQIAIQAALTGHLVLSTLHTNDAPGAITRLLDMGVPGYLVGSTLLGVLAQRLVRRLCPECAGSGAAGPARTRSAPARLEGGDGDRCTQCGGTGYRGRLCVAELMRMSAALRSDVAGQADAGALRHTAEAEGMRSLLADAYEKVDAGLTSREEVIRATGEAGLA